MIFVKKMRRSHQISRKIFLKIAMCLEEAHRVERSIKDRLQYTIHHIVVP
jgi:hypothetical protein